MALYDNKYWLLSHIRNSFISTDDTGICESIMSGEEGVRKRLKENLDLYPDEEDSEDDDDLSHESYDLQLDIDFGIRYRSNTAARLEKLEQVKKKTSRMKHVKWEMSKTPISQDQLDEMFVRKDLKSDEKPNKSQFSTTFKQYTELPVNPFIEFAKFDGSGQLNILTKKYRIFLTMLPEAQRNYPLHICCTATARIQDLIGLILLKCSTTYETHPWKPVTNYALYITEEDGEVDRDLPFLDPRENIAKFGFTCLGLVEHHDPTKFVSFYYSEPLIFNKSDESSDKKSRDQSKIEQEKQTSTDLHLMDVHNKAMEAPLYRSYRVFLINKMLPKIEIHLGISGEKIEIDPIQQNTKFSLVKQKPVSHQMDSIAWCETVEVKSNKTVFRLVYSSNFDNVSTSPLRTSMSFRSYEFEATNSIAHEIVQKVSLILELRSSEMRKQYLAAQERKSYKKSPLFK